MNATEPSTRRAEGAALLVALVVATAAAAVTAGMAMNGRHPRSLPSERRSGCRHGPRSRPGRSRCFPIRRCRLRRRR